MQPIDRNSIQRRNELMRQAKQLTGMTMTELMRRSTSELEALASGSTMTTTSLTPKRPITRRTPATVAVAPSLNQAPAPSPPYPPLPNPGNVVSPSISPPIIAANDPLAAALGPLFAQMIQPYLEDKTNKAEVEAIATAIARKVAEDTVGKLDEQRVKDLINEARIPQQLNINVTNVDTGVRVTIAGAHCQMPRLLYWVQKRKNVWLAGKPGGGKSTAAKQVATALDLQFGAIQLNMQTPESRLFGFYGADAATYRRTMFRDCYEQGGVFLIDEIDNANDGLLTTLNTALENDFCAFPDKRIDRHPDFVCIASANTAGRGGDTLHAGRRPVDGATLDRFEVLDWKYDLALEERLTLAINATDGLKWLGWVRAVRRMVEENSLPIVVSPRASFNGAAALLDSPKDVSVEEIADEVLFNKGVKPDVKKRILTTCVLPKFGQRKVMTT